MNSTDIEQRTFARDRIEILEQIRRQAILPLRHHEYSARFDRQGGRILWQSHDLWSRSRRTYSDVLMDSQSRTLYLMHSHGIEVRSFPRGRLRGVTLRHLRMVSEPMESFSEAHLLPDRILFADHADRANPRPMVIMLGDGRIRPLTENDAVRGVIAFADAEKAIICQSRDVRGTARLHAVNPMSGHHLWSVDIEGVSFPWHTDYVRIADRIYLATPVSITGVDLRHGRQIEPIAFDRGPGVPAPTHAGPGWARGRYRLATDGRHLLLLTGNDLEAFDPATGGRLWHRSLPPQPNRPRAGGDMVQPDMDPHHVELPPWLAAQVSPDGRLIIVKRSDMIAAYRVDTGEIAWMANACDLLPQYTRLGRWQFRVEVSFGRGADRDGHLAFHGDLVFVSTTMGILAMRVADGAEQYRIPIAGPIQADPLIHEGIAVLSVANIPASRGTPRNTIRGVAVLALPDARSSAAESSSTD
ncbi:MAG: hypothetical protein JJU36_15340 [Phycisphaeraceae bacterium]|nr:hypothetical protein [Phycisphaeraceae bacterium]